MVNKLIQRAVTLGVIRKDESKVYQYAYTVLLLWIAAIASLLVVSGLMGQLQGVLVFLLGYIPLRQTIGGVHLKSKILCYVVTVLAVSLIMVPVLLNVYGTITIVSLVLLFPSSVVIFTLAPQCSPNKPITEDEERRCKKAGRFLLIIGIAAGFILFFTGLRLYAYYLSLAINLAAANLLPGVFPRIQHSDEPSH